MSTSRSRKWIPFFGNIIVAACLALGAVDDALAQLPVSFGIKTGVPITSLLQTSGRVSWQEFSFASPTQKPNYAIGPVLDIRLPGQYSFEAGVMYKGILQQAPNVTLTNVVECTDPPICENSHLSFQTQAVSKVARSWEFPVVIQYHFSRPSSFRPYVEGGFSYNHMTGVFVTPGALPYNPRAPLPQLVESPYETNINRSGFVLGGGMEMKLLGMRVSPGIRYSRYDVVEDQSGPQQYGPFVSHTLVERPGAFDFMLGFKTKR